MDGLRIILAFVCGFVVAQTIKFIIALIEKKKNIWQLLLQFGGCHYYLGQGFALTVIIIYHGK